MKLFRKMTWCILLASCLATFTACSSDDPSSGPGTTPTPTPPVDTNKRPKSVGNMTMAYNGDGTLAKITTSSKDIVTFDYSKMKTRGIQDDNLVVMTVTDGDNPNDVKVVRIILNKKGYAQSCEQTNTASKFETWEFDYNDAGQITHMTRSEGGNEVTTIKYNNGNIVGVSMTSDNANNSLTANIAYTNSKTTAAILNQNKIMLFDETFDIDMDEMGYAYWAGLLGKPTTHLPVQISSKENNGAEEVDFFEWTLKDGYIQKMTATGANGKKEINFTW